MNVLVLNKIERNFEVDPPLHWVAGKTRNPAWFQSLLKRQTLTLETLSLGSNLSIYGNTVQKTNGKTTTQYVHIREGDYQWSVPLLFVSFHIEKMNT
jgi:hypothetical protein